MELHNFDPEVVDEIYKTASINLSPNVPGQVALGLMVNPPKIGDASYKQYRKEKDAVLDTLKIRAKRITDAFNALEGVVCQNTDGKLHYTLLSTFPYLFSLLLLTMCRCHVLLPSHHPTPCFPRGGQGQRQGPGRAVLPGAAGGDRPVLRARLRLQADPWHLPLPYNHPGKSIHTLCAHMITTNTLHIHIMLHLIYYILYDIPASSESVRRDHQALLLLPPRVHEVRRLYIHMHVVFLCIHTK